MFHPALLKLIHLQWKGGFRQFRHSLRTIRGLFHLGFIVVMLLYGAGSMYFFSTVASGSQQASGLFGTVAEEFLTIGLFVTTWGLVLFSSGEGSVYFTASEVAFLFPAPLTRKQLLMFKLLKSFIGICVVSVFFQFFSAGQVHLILPRLLGTILTLSFIQLLTMNVAFIRQLVAETVHVRVRQILGIVLGVLIIIAVNQILQSAPRRNIQDIANLLHQSTVGQWMLAPFTVFTRMLRISSLNSYLTSMAIVLAIDTVLLVSAIRLDALSLEAAFAFSEKMTTKLKRMQTKGVWQAMGTANSKVATRRIPQFPFLGGIGPVAWQRLTTTFRGSNQILVVAGIALAVAASLVYFTSQGPSGEKVAPVMGLGAMAYMSFLICLTLQNDIERVGFMKSLPLRTTSIVIGELLGFVVLLSAMQMVFITGVAIRFPTHQFWLLCGMPVVLPLNFLLFAIDKLVFYIYPTRLVKGAPGDFQNAGKQMIFVFLKMCILGGFGLILGVSTLPGALIFQSPMVAVASAVGVLILECVVVVPLVVVAFNRFDPGVTIVN
jgi:hypothetical protein